ADGPHLGHPIPARSRSQTARAPRSPWRLLRRHLSRLPAASAFTSLVVSGLPPTPQSPLLTSSRTTHVTGRRFSPSIDTIASVSLRLISCFCAGVNTPSISLTFTRGMAVLLSVIGSCLSDPGHRICQARAGYCARFVCPQATKGVFGTRRGRAGL